MEYRFNKIYMGSDAQGYSAKRMLFEFLRHHDLTVVDLGIFEIEEKVECDVLAREVGEKVIQNENALGLMLSFSDHAQKMYDAVTSMEGINPIMACAISDVHGADVSLHDANFLSIPCETEDFEAVRELLFAVLKK